MDPVTLIIVPGFLGGLVIALLLFRMQSPSRSLAPSTKTELSTDPINMAHIRVAGIGGLGLVAMALWVAWNVPRIWQHVALGAALGVAFAVGLIVFRRL